MDADLSTELKHLKEMVYYLKEYDMVIGDRLSRKSLTKRRFFRTFISKVYNTIARSYLGIGKHDLQCGFKGIKRNVFLEMDVRDDGFFFDSELTVLVEKKGYRIKNIPINWIERKASKVNVSATTKNYLSELYRLKKRLKQ